jgi:hypothetical protein
MCYGVYISTDSPKNLAEFDSEFVRFEKVTDPNSNPCIGLLDFPNKWYVGSKTGCSCTFRHLPPSVVELWFSEPVDWYEEEQDDLDATRELYGRLSDILSSGHQLDLVDLWEGSQERSQSGDITTLDVSLDDVSEREFHMLENHKFRLKKEK